MSRDDSKEIDAELCDADTCLTGRRGASLFVALERQPKPPCVDRGDRRPCEFYRRCASEQLACRAFYAYTREPEDRKEYGEWLNMPRVPTAKMYRKTYNEPKQKGSQSQT